MTAYLDDLVPGTVAELGSYLFTAPDIIAYARAYDPQPFHIDEVAARDAQIDSLERRLAGFGVPRPDSLGFDAPVDPHREEA